MNSLVILITFASGMLLGMLLTAWLWPKPSEEMRAQMREEIGEAYDRLYDLILPKGWWKETK